MLLPCTEGPSEPRWIRGIFTEKREASRNLLGMEDCATGGGLVSSGAKIEGVTLLTLDPKKVGDVTDKVIDEVEEGVEIVQGVFPKIANA